MLIHTDSMKGVRKSNEDESIIILNSNNTNKRLRPINLFCIFDGHGGNMISKWLKKNFAPFFIRKDIKHASIEDYKQFKEYINKVYDHIQRKLRIEFKNIAEHCGSTALTIFYFNHKTKSFIYVVNIGDSRAVICNKNNIAIPLTKDHKPHILEERKRIEKLIKKYPECNGEIFFDGEDWRIKDLSLSRAFGDMDASPFVSHRPDIFKYEICKKDKFIIMACDGLWDVMGNQDAVNFVLENEIAYDKTKLVCYTNRSGKNIASLLATHAISKGSTDNLTIIIIFL